LDSFSLQAAARRSVDRNRQDSPLLAEAETCMKDHVPRVFESGAGMKQVIEIEYVVVNSGRRPHGYLQYLDELRDCRAGFCPRG
jgi:hypothetical protein